MIMLLIVPTDDTESLWCRYETIFSVIKTPLFICTITFYCQILSLESSLFVSSTLIEYLHLQSGTPQPHIHLRICISLVVLNSPFGNEEQIVPILQYRSISIGISIIG